MNMTVIYWTTYRSINTYEVIKNYVLYVVDDQMESENYYGY